ncbi:MAG: DHH family phosphoesterase [Planctomycetaceae bacterium]|nr:DHH family phosphoesterase [Planctomycetaceae bacterium]
MHAPIDWQRFAEIVHSASKIVLTMHHRPDGDCVGSALAMQQILLRLGKNVRIIAPHQTPPNLAFLDPNHSITALENLDAEGAEYLQSADLFFVLDTSSWAQLGEMATHFRESSARKLVLDHHTIGDALGAETFINSQAEAAGTLVVQAANALGVPLAQDIALPAFVAIATDTGWFRFSSTTSETFRTAARLLDVGVQPDEVYKELYEQESLGRIRLVGRTLQKAEAYLEGQFLFTWIMLDDLAAAGAIPSDSEDIVNMLLQVQGSKMAALLSELRDGTFKVSFRSRCEVDCSLLASQFGGGGHKKAAGASLALPFEQAKQAVVDAVSAKFE